jgi:hypothetical protein
LFLVLHLCFNFDVSGYKRTNWEGGMRVTAFISGGLVPPKLRGTSNKIRMHIIDWYPTFCGLAGVPASDDAPVAPLPIDPSNPTKDIYQGNLSWPGLDGVDVWQMIIDPTNPKYNDTYSAAHPTIALSKEVLLKGKYKLLVAERGGAPTNLQGHYDYENGWEYPNGTWVQPTDMQAGGAHGCGLCTSSHGCGARPAGWKGPCLFDLDADPREEHDLGDAMPEVLASMWKELNDTWLGMYNGRSPASLLGPCNPACAKKHWSKLGSKFPDHAPICGIPGCAPAPSPPPPAPTPAPGPMPGPFPPSNSTDCTFVPNIKYDHRVTKGAKTSASTQEACCKHCYENDRCVAGAWHSDSSPTPEGCYLHYSADSIGEQQGVIGCVTSR